MSGNDIVWFCDESRYREGGGKRARFGRKKGIVIYSRSVQVFIVGNVEGKSTIYFPNSKACA